MDITSKLRMALERDRRAPDGKLHPSGDLIGPLRHSQLRAAGAPTVENEILSEVRLRTGTMWHSFFEEVLRGEPAMFEVKVDPWLPEGWSGTVDWLLWSREHEAFVLKDLKTIKPEGMKYIQSQGMKEEHLWQGSAYWYALEKMGLPLVRGFDVYYLPMGPMANEPELAPMLVEGMPLDRTLVRDTMNSRWLATQQYLTVIAPFVSGERQGEVYSYEHKFLNASLAPERERKQVLRWNSKMNVFDVKLEPHWTARYCPFPDDLCSCNHQKTEKIGHYYYELGKDECFYEPRKGYQAIQPTVKLNAKQRKELSGI